MNFLKFWNFLKIFNFDKKKKKFIIYNFFLKILKFYMKFLKFFEIL